MNKEITNILNESFSSQSVEKTLNELVVRLEKKKVIDRFAPGSPRGGFPSALRSPIRYAEGLTVP